MGAPIIIDGSLDLWVSNGDKDLFCEVVAEAAKLKDGNVSSVYDVAPELWTYGISGIGPDIQEFYSYFGGREGFRRRLDVCSDRIEEICDRDELGRKHMAQIIAWAKYMMDGGKTDEGLNAYSGWPPTLPTGPSSEEP